MNDKEKKAYDRLNENKILRDKEQEPVIRVALREIKDFALPLNVKYDNTTEIFWKWHMLNDQEAEQLIKSKLETIQGIKPEQKIEKKIEIPMEKKETKSEKIIQEPETKK